MIKIVPNKYKYGIYILFGIVVVGFTLYIYNKVSPQDYGHKVVVCIPVYGQSYALGEENYFIFLLLDLWFINSVCV